MFTKILIANRGEIAVRVIRTCREMGIETTAVFSEADRTAPHVQFADEAYCIGEAPSSESYLRMDRIIDVARSSGAEAIHPGYGFLSENPNFPDNCASAGITFIGPSAEAIRVMGSKTSARKTMKQFGVPIVPGTEDSLENDKIALEVAESIGYPVLVKAAMGGGGKGMRIVDSSTDLASALRAARSEAESAFGDSTVYMEKYLVEPRHVEFQILADHHGNVVHLGERECSVQRRHQKLIEESPSCILEDSLRAAMGEAAIKAAGAVGYTNAGTVEFIVDQDRCFYFLEMNTRLQVEHPVTEMITGEDLVRRQIEIAAGIPLPFKQEEVQLRGAAIECRISAEDSDENFMPSIGLVTHLAEPGGSGVRVDSGFCAGYEVQVYYDPMIAKLIVWAPNRDEAISRMKRALSEYAIGGIKTTIPFHIRALSDPRFKSGDYSTGFVETMNMDKVRQPDEHDIAAAFAAIIKHRETRKKIQQGTDGNENSPSPESAWKLAGRREAVRRESG
tara:strand:+ start:392 stop:1909 length:1518 start_codon:yes stop_codon:yes gene_type:complete